ncbi:DUF692 domain-containing protein [Microbispora sp. H10836]|uniref:DUF692 domain-containing protein n=1 Tax=Microbispora sp. H10836 TaxID=2729106 RepID=UPI002892FC3F|nr:DUF692 domain-containing protein [Microbispora sp. H10836]
MAERRFGRWLPSGRPAGGHKRHAAGVGQSAGRSAGLGVGIGWRPEIDLTVERLPGVGFVEVIAENVDPARPPESLTVLRAAGVPVVPHGVGLGVGGAHRPDPARLARLAACAEALDAPLVSEHVAFVRAGGVEAGHLLPVPRTREALSVIVENVREAQDALPVPLALENVAALFGWPDDELTEARFLGELVERTGVRLLVDVANLYTNQVNLGLDARRALDALPLEAVAYVHVAGGHAHDGLWHDTRAGRAGRRPGGAGGGPGRGRTRAGRLRSRQAGRPGPRAAGQAVRLGRPRRP